MRQDARLRNRERQLASGNFCTTNFAFWPCVDHRESELGMLYELLWDITTSWEATTEV